MFQGNWVDLVILVVLAYFITQAWRVGVWVILADFVSFLLSLLIALRSYQFAAEFLRRNFSLAHSVSNALGFLSTAVFIEALLGFFLTDIIRKIPYKLWKNPWNRLLAVLPALGEGIVIAAFFLTLVIGLPIAPWVKSDITESKIGGPIVQKTQGLEKAVNEIFGGVIEDSLTYLTVKPQSRERVPLDVSKKELTVDEKSESEMFSLVNAERRKNGVPELAWAPLVVPVAREHARDMWEREYFGHVSPEGEDVGDRLNKAKVKYGLAGENLALAPTLSTAHTGLMNSEGHRANILEPKFKKIGIGVIDNEVFGKMFVQVFTD